MGLRLTEARAQSEDCNFQRNLRRAVQVLVAGSLLLGLSGLSVRSPDGNYRGYPWSFTEAISPCHVVNPVNGCGSTVDPLGLGFDIVFWTLIGLILVSAADMLMRYRHSPDTS